jgi:hypothetical protein
MCVNYIAVSRVDKTIRTYITGSTLQLILSFV